MLSKDDFRLRKDSEIVGYKRNKGNYTFYSKDTFHWKGTPIEYFQKDRCTSFRDRNNSWIFEEDIIRSTDYPGKCYVVTYDNLLTKFLLVELGEELIFEGSIELFCRDKNNIVQLTFNFIN